MSKKYPETVSVVIYRDKEGALQVYRSSKKIDQAIEDFEKSDVEPQEVLGMMSLTDPLLQRVYELDLAEGGDIFEMIDDVIVGVYEAGMKRVLRAKRRGVGAGPTIGHSSN